MIGISAIHCQKVKSINKMLHTWWFILVSSTSLINDLHVLFRSSIFHPWFPILHPSPIIFYPYLTFHLLFHPVIFSLSSIHHSPIFNTSIIPYPWLCSFHRLSFSIHPSYLSLIFIYFHVFTIFRTSFLLYSSAFIVHPLPIHLSSTLLSFSPGIVMSLYATLQLPPRRSSRVSTATYAAALVSARWTGRGGVVVVAGKARGGRGGRSVL